MSLRGCCLGPDALYFTPLQPQTPEQSAAHCTRMFPGSFESTRTHPAELSVPGLGSATGSAAGINQLSTRVICRILRGQQYGHRGLLMTSSGFCAADSGGFRVSSVSHLYSIKQGSQNQYARRLKTRCPGQSSKEVLNSWQRSRQSVTLLDIPRGPCSSTVDTWAPE